MKIPLLTIAALTVLFSPAKAQENRAFSQLLNETSLSIPVPPLPDRGGQVSGAVSWDPSAPFSYHQKPAEITSRGRSAVRIKNVRWGELPADKKSHSWETATVMPELLERAYYGYKTAGTGHSLLVFVFKKGGFVNSKGEASAALTIGAEGYTREPEGYNPVNGLLGRYPLIWNLSTLANYADFNINLKKTDVLLAPINISRADQLQLLEAALARIEKTNRAPGETYDTFSNNCTTLPVSLINPLLPDGQRIDMKTFFVPNPDAAFPKKAVAKYTELGALSPEITSLNKDTYKKLEVSRY